MNFYFNSYPFLTSYNPYYSMNAPILLPQASYYYSTDYSSEQIVHPQIIENKNQSFETSKM
jgi:hypothetical protein